MKTRLSSLSTRSFRVQSALVAALSTLAFVPVQAEAEIHDVGVEPQCQEREVSVTSLPGIPGNHTISGTMCHPETGPTDNIQVLVPGATYNRSYWDSPVPGYSYIQDAARNGQSTFAIDRLNTGNSSRVPPTLHTIPVDANALHQVITALREGRVDGRSYPKIGTMGHSLGSIIVSQEASTYHDVDAVALTGYTHLMKPKIAVGLLTGQIVVPAQQTDRMSDRAPGALSTAPGEDARSRWFHWTENINPEVVRADEATKNTLSVGELATFAGELAGPQSNLIDVPVMLIQADHDEFFPCGLGPCNTKKDVLESERIHYASAPTLDAHVVNGSGHCIALSESKDEFYDVAENWFEQSIG